MNADSTLNKSGSFILSQLGYSHREIRQKGQGAPAITISQRAPVRVRTQLPSTSQNYFINHSRQTRHNGKSSIASWWKSARRVRSAETPGAPHVKIVARMSRMLWTKCFGLRAALLILVLQIPETIEQILEAGHAIVVGRGSSAIASEMKGIFTFDSLRHWRKELSGCKPFTA